MEQFTIRNAKSGGIITIKSMDVRGVMFFIPEIHHDAYSVENAYRRHDFPFAGIIWHIYHILKTVIFGLKKKGHLAHQKAIRPYFFFCRK